MRGNDVIRHFRFIIIPKPVGGLPLFEEYRTNRAGKPIEVTSGAGLTTFTSNFAGSWIYFSPSDQPHNRFRYFGTQPVQKRACYVVGFAQDPKVTRTYAAFQLVDPPAAAVLLVQGLAWIDKQSFQILRMETWLLAPRSDIQLESADTVVNFFSVQPGDVDRTVWVPHDVTVTTLYQGRKAQNTHRYSNFQIFRVESTLKPAE